MGLLPFGAAATMGIQSVVFKDTEDIYESLHNLINTQNVIVGIIFVLFQLVIREKPDVPPSAVAEAEEDNRDLCQSFREMKDNSNFMLLALTFAITFGSYVGFGNCISNILSPYGL